jgi:DNA-binding NtrC family response regulator
MRPPANLPQHVEVVPGPAGQPAIVGRSPAMQYALYLCRVYGPCPLVVVLAGPTGSGKSLLARYIHAISGRGALPFVEFTAAEIANEIGADRLFGHEVGGYTTAVTRVPGALAEAGSGTLLVDDLHLMDVRRQALFLRALETRMFRPHGSTRDHPIRCRIIVGMRCDPDQLLRDGVLLEDLRWRLGRLLIAIPPLSERREDIVPLAEHFLARCPDETRVPGPTRFAPDVRPVLEAGLWPGNARDLRETIRAAYLLAQDEDVLRLEHLPPNAFATPHFDRRASPQDKQRVIDWALERAKGVGDAARLVGAHRNTIRNHRRRASCAPADAQGAQDLLPNCAADGATSRAP